MWSQISFFSIPCLRILPYSDLYFCSTQETFYTIGFHFAFVISRYDYGNKELGYKVLNRNVFICHLVNKQHDSLGSREETDISNIGNIKGINHNDTFERTKLT